MVWIMFGLTRTGLRPVETPQGVTDGKGKISAPGEARKGGRHEEV